MNADKYLESIGLENVIDEEFFNNDDKSWYKVQELMESYHQAKLKLLGIADVVGRSELLKAFVEWQIQGNTPYAGMLIDEHIRAYFKSL